MILDIEQLERWVTFGATWHAAQWDDHAVVVDFCTCTGELVERRRSTDPVVIDYVRRFGGGPPSSFSGSPRLS